jgi:hypothetical protein
LLRLAMKRQSKVGRKLQELRAAYQSYRMKVVRLMLLLLLMLMVAAQLFPPVAEFVVQRKFFTFAVVLGVVLVLFDVLLSHDRAPEGSDASLVLPHFWALREHLEQAFESGVVELDIAAYSGETFYNVLSEFLGDVADGRRQPRRLHVRILVPDCSAPMAIPCRMGDLGEDASYRESIQVRNRRFAGLFRNYFDEIRQRAQLANPVCEIRVHGLAPLFKMIVINGTKGFFAFYPIADTSVEFPGEIRHLWDYRGEQARFIGFSASGGSAERELLASLNEWFGTVWGNLSTKLE